MPNECLEVLKNGIYETHITTRTGNHSVDYKHYFESEEFKSDFQNGKFSLGVGVVLEGLPIKLDYGSDETEIKQFQQKIKDTTDFKMSDNFFFQSAEIIPNKDIINAYKECLEHHGFGFYISYETTESSITFRVYYSNLQVTLPKLQDVFITPSSKLVFQSVNKGEEIKNNSESKFVFELAKDTKEVVFILDTDLTAVSEKAEIKRKGIEAGGLPLGTIICSYLTWNQFQKMSENNKESGGIWKSESSFWSPCDGREVPNSKFSSEASVTTVPDYRGVFLRGLNDFAIDGTRPNPVNDQLDKWVGRTRDGFQDMGIQSHNHSIHASVSAAQIRGDGGSAGDYPTDGATGFSGGDETRPKNFAVYYYIRIN